MRQRTRNWIGLAAATGIAATAAGVGLVGADTTPNNTLTTIAPCRLVDTRDASPVGERLSPIGANETVTFIATGNMGNCTDITATATAVTVNITATNATATSFFTLFPADETAVPTIAQLNFATVPPVTSNSTTVTLSSDGEFKLFNGFGQADVIIDLLGYYAPGGPGTAGPQGETGPQGEAGPAGADGAPGADGANGLDGADGADGAPGADGANGLDGADGADGAPGVPGPPGPPGTPGTNGTDGVDGIDGVDGVDGAPGPATPATYTNPEWGVVLRNTTGAASATLRGGPFSYGLSGPILPPYGEGSVQIQVPTGSEKVDFGNEFDFFGDDLTMIDEIGFQWFATGESNALAANNVPVIRLEIDPNAIGTHLSSDNYASLVFVPNAESPNNDWTGYVDATDDAAGTWFLTGAPAADDCRQAAPCTWSVLQTYINSGPPFSFPSIYSVSVGKGTDSGFQGAIDGLQINDTIYDFEPLGVLEVPVAP